MRIVVRYRAQFEGKAERSEGDIRLALREIQSDCVLPGLPSGPPLPVRPTPAAKNSGWESRLAPTPAAKNSAWGPRLPPQGAQIARWGPRVARVDFGAAASGHTGSGLPLEKTAEDPRAPLRGVMLALVLSGILWTGLILSARELWALFH
jgi:hypothetical protein